MMKKLAILISLALLAACTPKTVEQSGAVYEFVTKATQKEAMDFLNTQVFTTPKWLINKDVTEKTRNVPTVTILSLQEQALSRVLSTYTMGKMLNAEAALGKDTYTVTDLLGDLKQNIFTELPAKKAIDIYRRNLQKAYVERIALLLNPPPPQSIGGFTIIQGPNPFGTPLVDSKKSDILSAIKGHARELKALADAAAAGSADKATKYHLQDISDRLSKALNPKS